MKVRALADDDRSWGEHVWRQKALERMEKIFRTIRYLDPTWELPRIYWYGEGRGLFFQCTNYSGYRQFRCFLLLDGLRIQWQAQNFNTREWSNADFKAEWFKVPKRTNQRRPKLAKKFRAKAAKLLAAAKEQIQRSAERGADSPGDSVRLEKGGGALSDAPVVASDGPGQPHDPPAGDV